VLRQLHVESGETLLLFGAGGSVGIIATQLAVAQGVRVISAVGEHMPMQQAAEAHRQLEGGNIHERIILTLE
jgi:NADPH-dependent curcumin reductase CurA